MELSQSQGMLARGLKLMLGLLLVLGGLISCLENSSKDAEAKGSSSAFEKAWACQSEVDKALLERAGFDELYFKESTVGKSEDEVFSIIVGKLIELQNVNDRHETGTTVGNALEWRRLLAYPDGRKDDSAVLAGNFDDDSGWELLSIHSGGMQILQVPGGEVRELPLDGFISAPDLAWDCDGDGVMELLCSIPDPGNDWGHTNEMQVLTTKGELMCTLTGQDNGFPQYRADWDGDGFVDLLLGEQFGHRYSAPVHIYGLNGVELFYTEDVRGNLVDCFMDLDNDGRAEFLASSDKEAMKLGNWQYRAYGMDQDVTWIDGVSPSPSSGSVFYAVDFAQDGIAEVVTYRAIINVSTGSETARQLPEGWLSMDFPRTRNSRMCEFDYAGERMLAAIAMENPGSERSDTLVMWDITGKLKYQQHFDQALQGICNVSVQEEDFLVLEKEDGIYITSD